MLLSTSFPPSDFFGLNKSSSFGLLKLLTEDLIEDFLRSHSHQLEKWPFLFQKVFFHFFFKSIVFEILMNMKIKGRIVSSRNSLKSQKEVEKENILIHKIDQMCAYMWIKYALRCVNVMY